MPWYIILNQQPQNVLEFPTEAAAEQFIEEKDIEDDVVEVIFHEE